MNTPSRGRISIAAETYLMRMNMLKLPDGSHPGREYETWEMQMKSLLSEYAP
jgi:hypothetical protein